MDLLALIRTKVEALPEGPHRPGLNSVYGHIEIAYTRLLQGEKDSDDSFFADVIYRTNQAFEGGIKEAYRVLAGKDPHRMRPYDIEQYLENEEVFPDRVLGQFKNYRSDWRNASTHDHNLYFGKDEAFLAIVSVSAFVKMLVDQVSQELAKIAARDEAVRSGIVADSSKQTKFIDKITSAFQAFSRHYSASSPNIPIETETQLIGAISGFLSLSAPDLQITTGRVFRADRPYYTDMVITRGPEVAVVELKRGQHQALVDQGIAQLAEYSVAARAQNAILFLYNTKATDYEVSIPELPPIGVDMRVVRPRITSGTTAPSS